MLTESSNKVAQNNQLKTPVSNMIAVTIDLPDDFSTDKRRVLLFNTRVSKVNLRTRNLSESHQNYSYSHTKNLDIAS